MTARPTTSDSIGIVGAGPSGLTVAEELRTRGYSDVTILEAGPNAGGKARSRAANADHAVTELGTTWYIPGPIYQKYLARYGIGEHGRTAPPLRVFDRETRETYDAFARPKGVSPLHWVRSLLRLRKELQPFGDAGDIGFRDGAYSSLDGTATGWMRERGIDTLANRLMPIATCTQFGYLEPETPSAYVVKGLGLLGRLPLRQRLSLSYPQIPVGHQEVWKRLAATHHVKYDSKVVDVRRGERIEVETEAEKFSFDHLVWCAPTKPYRSTTAASTDEIEIFSRERTIPRSVGIYRTSGLDPSMFLAIRSGKDWGVPAGFPSAVGSVAGAKDLHTFYTFLDPSLNSDLARSGAEELASLLGGRIVDTYVEPRPFDWFPRFDSADIQTGILEKCERLQGVDRIYFAGELFSGVSVAFASEYAADLVGRWF